MNFSKEQKDYIIHALEHCEILTGGRSSGKTLELIKQQEQEIKRLNNRLKTSNDTCNYLRNTIDKAIKWINENQYYFPRPDELSKILKGSDSNE